MGPSACLQQSSPFKMRYAEGVSKRCGWHTKPKLLELQLLVRWLPSICSERNFCTGTSASVIELVTLADVPVRQFLHKRLATSRVDG